MKLLLFLWGCSEKEMDSASNDTAELLPDCATIDVDECGTYAHCVGISGYQLDVDDANACYELGEQHIVGCMDAEMGCGDAITFASDASETSYWFPSTCIPEGWTEQDILNAYTEGCSQTSIDCYELSVSECDTVDSCTYISGFERIENDLDECYELQEAEPIGCMPINEGCEPVVLNMQDPTTGSCYQINHGCTPPEWSYCENLNETLSECSSE